MGNEREAMTLEQYPAKLRANAAFRRKVDIPLATFLDELADAIDAHLRAVKPVYQVWKSEDSCGEFWSWEDVNEEEYAKFGPDNRRILYTHPSEDAS